MTTAQAASSDPVYETAVLYPAAGKLDELQSLWTDELTQAKNNAPGILSFHLFTAFPPPLVTPPGIHGGHGPVVFPKLVLWIVFQDGAAQKEYQSTSLAALRAKVAEQGLLREQPELYVMKSVDGFDRKDE